MNITKKLNRNIDYIFAICLIFLLILFSSSSMFIYAIVPVLLSIISFEKDFKDLIFLEIGILLIGILFFEIKNLIIYLLPIYIITFLFIYLIKSDLSAKKKILISSLSMTIIFTIIYRYNMLENGITIDSLSKDILDIIDNNMNTNIDINQVKIALSLYPSLIFVFSNIYGILSLKTISNYLKYKNIKNDDYRLNQIRLEKKDLLYMFITLLVIDILALILKVETVYIKSNLIMIITFIFILNGTSVYDFMIRVSRSPVSYRLQWFFIIIFIQFFLIIFFIFGILDIFVDFRKKFRRGNAGSW